ncbi:hypothetical protein HUT19_11740 [Streptomyces sp. NA02950]|uniref:hypothetical protein n=1 Tax=Streptomyces sp. NA02950 TaxID=2742137 RepID=UPI00159123F1|nr:hypothetical protein [Streptomyces sp. NA02950]QKV92337.1 hypothetical protein HUT19_11740 [Streptomyces sp. NA02950]
MKISTGEPHLITGSDIDDLVVRVRLNGSGTPEGDAALETELEAARAFLCSPGEPDPAVARLVRQRLVVIALRHGGALLAKLLTRLSSRETAMVRRYAHRLAGFLDSLEIWTAQPIRLALMRIGLCYAEAEDIAAAVLVFVR